MRWLTRLERKSVVVHCDDGQSIRGVLQHVYADAVVVAHAEALRDDGTAVPVDGAAVIPRPRVAWIQMLPADGGSR